MLNISNKRVSHQLMGLILCKNKNSKVARLREIVASASLIKLKAYKYPKLLFFCLNLSKNHVRQAGIKFKKRNRISKITIVLAAAVI